MNRRAFFVTLLAAIGVRQTPRTIYLTPYQGNGIWLYDRTSEWTYQTMTWRQIQVPQNVPLTNTP